MKLYTLLLLLCAALPIKGAALDSLAFTPDTQSVNVWDTFTLSLDIGKLTQHLRSCPGFLCFINESSLFAWQVEIDYDPNVFQALQVDEGTFLPGTDTTTWFPGFIDDSNGSISFILESLTNGSSGVNTDLTGGQLLTVTFQALAASLGSTISIAPGSCFQATIDLGTTDCTISTFLNTSATATVSVASSAVPEPSLWMVNALMLLAMGVAGLPVRRLRTAGCFETRCRLDTARSLKVARLNNSMVPYWACWTKNAGSNMFDRGFFLTRQAIARQLAAMPVELYLVRLIHGQRRVPLPGERLWTRSQLTDMSTIRFLRARNSQGWDVYLLPYAESQNAGYLLVDLDVAPPAVIETMQANGHEPCVVLRTSPGHLQAWVCLGSNPLEPVVATAAAQLLARQYGGDLASADWRHLGRLAGFTNQKPTRCTWTGLAPWVTVVHARADKIQQMARTTVQARSSLLRVGDLNPGVSAAVNHASDPQITAIQAWEIYRDCMQRWHILERFPQPDWSIVDLWVARHLLSQHTPAARVKSILQLASPHFPRRHGDPDDYLRRTLARAGFPAPGAALCDFAARGSPNDRGR